jgi:hypothetical protein
MPMNNTIIFRYGKYAQITSKHLHFLCVHDNNRSNNGQIGQVVPMGGNEKPNISSNA